MIQKVAVGIDIGGTNTVFGIVTESGYVLYENNISSRAYKDVNSFIRELAHNIKDMMNKSKIEIELKGIGIGAPNGNFYTGSIDFAPNLVWEGVIPLSKLVKEHFNVPVLVTNDANAGALGEMLYGGAKNMKDFIFITLGTGLGSGIVSNGRLIYGHDGFAGEIGHTIVVHNGRDCGCGRKGCLETYVSATGIVRTAKELLKNTENDSLLINIDPEELSSKLIYDKAKSGDDLSSEVFDITAELLGRNLANAVAYTSPEAIFLFGGLANAEDMILKPVKGYMEKNLLNIYKNKVQILSSELPGNSAAILGASALVWDELKLS